MRLTESKVKDYDERWTWQHDEAGAANARAHAEDARRNC